MANEDDDHSFGEFTFAPLQSTVNSSPNIPTTTTNNNDVVWADFTFHQTNPPNHSVNPPLPSPSPSQPKWEKIQGALPLSFFGDDEESVNDNVKFEQSNVSVTGGFGSDINSNNNNNKKNGYKSNGQLGINDLITDLYGPRQQTVNELDFSALTSTESKIPVLKSNSNLLSSLGLDTVLAGDGDQESDEEGGWEFVDAVARNDKDHKETSEKIVSTLGLQGGSHGPIDLFAASNNGFFVEANVTDSGLDTKPITNFQNGFSVDLKVDSNVTANELSSDPLDGADDFDDTFGEFETAFLEHSSVKKEISEKIVSTSGLQGSSHGPIDLFAASNNGFFVESHVTDNVFDSKPITNFQNGFSVDLKVDSKSTTNELSSNPLGAADDFDDTFGKFETAFMEPSSVNKELSEERFDPLGSHNKSHGSVDLFSFSNAAPSVAPVENSSASDPFFQTEWKGSKDDSDSKPSDVGANDESFGKFEMTFQESELKPEGFDSSKKNYKEPVPLTIFGIEEDPEADTSLNLEHEFFKSSTKHTRNPSSNLSINDILSDLYSQAQPNSSDGKEDSLHFTTKEYVSHVADHNDNDDDDGFNDDSWEFKDASFQSSVENQSLSFEKKLNNCVNLYSNLKDDLCAVARRHLRSLKKAQSTATLVGEEMKVASLNKEIQEALEKIHQEDISTEMNLDDHSEGFISLQKYIETFQEPDFQIWDSEYQISRRLLLAESDLSTAIDLINHFTTILQILTLAPKCEPADYVSLWFKVISVCSQELNHGTWIWKQSLEKNVHSEILSGKQGREFIIALGEIYRAVMIMESAVKLYKPWILLSGADLEGISGLLEECHILWSTSRFEESIPVDYLLESIRHIQNLDEMLLADQILSQEETRCGISLLSPGVVPDMKMVTWNEDKYFVTLANLWAHLISPDPPKLSIHVG